MAAATVKHQSSIIIITIIKFFLKMIIFKEQRRSIGIHVISPGYVGDEFNKKNCTGRRIRDNRSLRKTTVRL